MRGGIRSSTSPSRENVEGARPQAERVEIALILIKLDDLQRQLKVDPEVSAGADAPMIIGGTGAVSLLGV